MQVKRYINNTIVFVSVFAGTIIGDGIAFITAAAPGKKVNDKLKASAQKIKEDVNHQIQSSSIKIIESTAVLEKKAATVFEDVRSLAESAKKSFLDAFEAEKEKYGRK